MLGQCRKCRPNMNPTLSCLLDYACYLASDQLSWYSCRSSLTTTSPASTSCNTIFLVMGPRLARVSFNMSLIFISVRPRKSENYNKVLKPFKHYIQKLHFYPIEAVPQYRDTQLKVGEIYLYLFNFETSCIS